MSVQCHACVGSTSIAEGTRDGQQILSGTPGRVFGQLIYVTSLNFTAWLVYRAHNLRTRSVKLLILDEADEMLYKGV
jgi:ATP-dependent RNA helicase